jgi:hypothetical protein
VLGSVRAVVRSVDADMPVNNLQPMRALMDDAVSQPRVGLSLFGGFAAVAALLAAVGLLGVMAFTVTPYCPRMNRRPTVGKQMRALAIAAADRQPILVAQRVLGSVRHSPIDDLTGWRGELVASCLRQDGSGECYRVIAKSGRREWRTFARCHAAGRW